MSRLNLNKTNSRFQGVSFLFVLLTATLLIGVVGCGNNSSTEPNTEFPFPPSSFSFEHEVLILDDFRDQIWPRDAQRDAFWKALVDNSGRFAPGDLDFFGSHGLDDVEYRDPLVPTAAVLGNYKLLVFDTSAAGYNGRSTLVQLVENGVLSTYLRAGGKVWVTGELTAAAMDPTITGQGNFAYPKAFTPGSFGHDFIKFGATGIANDKNTDNETNGLVAAVPITTPSTLPRLNLDLEKRQPLLRDQGIGNYDALPSDLGIRGLESAGVLETLYQAEVKQPEASEFQDLVIATRWHDPDDKPAHGRVAWFGFPLYYMENEAAQKTFNRMIDWFNEGH